MGAGCLRSRCNKVTLDDDVRAEGMRELDKSAAPLEASASLVLASSTGEDWIVAPNALLFFEIQVVIKYKLGYHFSKQCLPVVCTSHDLEIMDTTFIAPPTR